LEEQLQVVRLKMESILIQQGCADALKGEVNMLVFLFRKEKTNMINKAMSAIIMCLGDKTLRGVMKEKTAHQCG